MDRPEFMRLRVADMPDSIVKQYDLQDKVTKDGYVSGCVSRGMYELPQARIIAQ